MVTEDPETAEVLAQMDLDALLDHNDGWVSDAAALEDAQCIRLWTAVEAAMRLPTPPQGAIWCGLSLALGRDVSDLAATFAATRAPGASWWEGTRLAFGPDVTGATPRQLGRNAIVMHLPEPLADAVKGLPSRPRSDQARQALETWLSIVQPSGHRPRISRIGRALADGLAAAGEDVAVIGLLCGERAAQAVQLYYANVPVERLENAWRRHLAERLGCRAASTARITGLGRNQRVGSQRGPSAVEVQDWFACRAEQVITARRRAHESIHTLADLHAAVTAQIAPVLALVCARRPHGPAFEPLASVIGQRRPRIRIFDKGSRMVSDARWVPLPPVALQALALWRREIEALIDPARGLGLLNPCLVRHAAKALKGEVPPFFTLSSIQSAPVELTSARLWDMVSTPAAKPRNWARHFMRRELADAGLPGAVIDAWMGHGGSFMDPLRPTSGASLAGQDELAEAIERICAPLVHLSEIPA